VPAREDIMDQRFHRETRNWPRLSAAIRLLSFFLAPEVHSLLLCQGEY